MSLTVDSLPSYRNTGYFQGDSLLHSEVSMPLPGYEAEAVPFRFSRDGWGILLLLLCFVLAASLLTRFKGKIQQEFRDFFYPPCNAVPIPPAENRLGPLTRITSCLLLSFSLGIVSFEVTQREVTFYPFKATPYLLTSAFTVLWLVYFIMKRILSNFVNWVFFSRERIFTWNRSLSLLYATESVLIVPIVLVVVLMPMPLQISIVLIAAGVILFKLLTFYKALVIFFPKYYGFLHLLLYLCILEVMPLLVVLKLLTYADHLRGIII